MEAERKKIEVSMAEVKFASSPDILATRGLGSCVGIVMYDSIRKIGALAHPMLSDISNAKVRTNPAKFVDPVITMMFEKLQQKGALRHTLRAKLFGGAHMFSAVPSNSPFNIGTKNVAKAKEVLDSLGIKIIAEETGGNYGRTVELDLATGKVKIKTIFHGEKEV